MLADKPAFEGEDVSDTLANVLKREPDWNALPSDIPTSIHVLVRRCLEKDRQQRIGDISTAHFLVTEPASIAAAAPASAAGPAPAPQLATWQRVLLLAVGALAVAILGGAAVWLAMRPSPPRVVRTLIAPSSAATLTVSGADRDVAITPVGSHVVYIGSNGTQLFVRALGQLEATPRSPEP